MKWPHALRMPILRPFVGKATPDVPEPKPEPTQREMTRRWQELAIDIGLMTGRIRKGNSFAFSMSLERSSATVPAATFDAMVEAGIIDAQGNMLAIGWKDGEKGKAL